MDGCNVGDGISHKTCCGKLLLDESMALGLDPEKLIVREANEEGEGRGAIGEGDGVASGGTGNICVAEAKR